jgi:class 3 adenylate cyclase
MATSYATVNGAAVAYRRFGEGPPDILLMIGEYIPVDAMDEEPRYARCLRRLSSLGRVIVFDRRGTGVSDAPSGTPSVQDHVDDAIGILDFIGSEKAIVIAWNVSGLGAIRLAATHRDRVVALVLINSFARIYYGDDYPIGAPREFLVSTAEQTTAIDPQQEFDFLTAFAPSVAGDQRFRTWWDHVGQRGASPARAAELWQILIDADETKRLPEITAPTLIVQRTDIGPMQNTQLGQYMADNIPASRYVALPGADLMWWVGDSDAILDEIETFITGTGVALRAQRKLATVLFVDVIGSTERAAALGDRRWREVLATYHELTQRELARSGGIQVGTAGDGIVATFEMPADAVRCARSIAEGVRALDVDVRAGVHTGEIEILGDDVAGIGVHIAARIMAAAGPGEVLVSRTVSDLVTGSGLTFEERGEHELRGVPGRWSLYAAV